MKLPGWLDTAEHTPEHTGWYATLYCYDPEEGVFPGANYWDGLLGWDDKQPILWFSPAPFQTKKEAVDWAYEHDPDL